MTRRQLLILLALSLPLVTVFDLPSAVRAMMADLTSRRLGAERLVENSAVIAGVVDRDVLIQDERAAQLSDVMIESVVGDRRSDFFPDATLIDHHGQTVKFRTDLVRDRICCIVFFYTNCEGSCPGTLQQVKRLRRDLASEFRAEELQFVAITLDPELDTSDRLRDYAEQLGISDSDGLGDWRFCTGKLADIEQVRRSLGLYEIDPELDADRSQHAALITFGNDRTDRWTALPSGITFNDLSETFLRIAGTSEQQRFATRIARSAMMNAAVRPASLEGTSAEKCPKETCSLPDGP